MKSKKIINTAPKIKPKTTGKNAKFPILSCACSSAGIRSDQIDAESIMPAASPIVSILTRREVLLKKNTRLAPSVVIRKGSVNPSAIVTISFIFRETPTNTMYVKRVKE